MAAVEIRDCAAIGNNHVLEAPIVAENILKKACIATAGFIVQALIRTHDLADVGLLDQRFEGRKVRFIEIPRVDSVEVDRVAARFRAGMDCKVLATRQQLPIFCIGRSLQSFHNRNTHA